MLIDITLLLILVYAFYRGFSKGLIHSIFSMLGWLLGIALACKLTTALAPQVSTWLHTRENWVPMLTFLLILAAVVVLVWLLGKAVEKIFDLTHLGIFNKVAGAVLSVAVFYFIFAQVLVMMHTTHIMPASAEHQSKLYTAVSGSAPVMMEGVSFALPFARNFYSELKDYLQHV